MKIKKIKNRGYLYYEDEKYLSLHEAISKKKYTYLKTLKEDKRSHVFLIQFEEKKYVIKKPLEKNKRGWQRFISIFRGGESKREFKSCKRVLDSGFKGALPILAWEKVLFKMVVDSYSVAEYIEGKGATFKEIGSVVNLLKNIHDKGLLHGDPHLGNFMIAEKEIYLIDCKLSKNLSGNFGKAYEVKYLENSCHNGCKLYRGKEFYYWIAVKRDEFYHWWRKFKNKMRGR